MASKIIKIKVSNASNLQIQTLLLEIGLIIKQWFRKVKVKIEVIKQYGLKNANNNGFKCHYLFCYYMARFNVVIDLTLFSFYDVIIIERIKYEKYIWCYGCMVNARCVNWLSIRINFNYENRKIKPLVINLTGGFLFVII